MLQKKLVGLKVTQDQRLGPGLGPGLGPASRLRCTRLVCLHDDNPTRSLQINMAWKVCARMRLPADEPVAGRQESRVDRVRRS